MFYYCVNIFFKRNQNTQNTYIFTLKRSFYQDIIKVVMKNHHYNQKIKLDRDEFESLN